MKLLRWKRKKCRFEGRIRQYISNERLFIFESVLFQRCIQSVKCTTYKTYAEVIKLFSYSTQLSAKFILLINVKMPTIVGILTFNSMINTTPETPWVRNFFICRSVTMYWVRVCRYFSFYKELKFPAQLSWAWNTFYDVGGQVSYQGGSRIFGHFTQFCQCFFCSLILQRGSSCLFQWKIFFPQWIRGAQVFPGGPKAYFYRNL